MKVSVITAVLNGRDVIEDCILSVAAQTWQDIEHIVIDGGSSDGTVEIIKKHERHIAKWVTGPDKGPYQAFNKGIAMASGDIIGFLHSDDLYENERVIATVVSGLEKGNADSCYGDLVYVNRNNTEKVIRYWRSCQYEEGLFEKGWMPPHPTFFAKRHVYEKNEHFHTGFRISADYELMLRFITKNRVSTCYIPEVLVRMRVGGVSNKGLKNVIIKTMEDYRAWSANGLNRRFYTIPLKNILKIPQFFKR